MTTQQTEVKQGASLPATGVLQQVLARRKADAQRGRPPELPKTGPSTPARAAAIAVGRVAERLHALPLQPLAVEAGALTMAEMLEVLPECPLLAVLQGPGESLGVIALCSEAVAALIESQTLGRVTNRPAERRRPTRSEALLCTDFINALLAELRADLAGMAGFEAMGPFRFIANVDEPRSLPLLLEHDAFRSIDFQLRLGAPASRDGRILLALPQAEAQLRPVAAPAAAPVAALPQPLGETLLDTQPETAPPPDTPEVEDIAAAVQNAPVEVVGVLCRRRITLGELRGLTEGRLLMLPRARLSEARLETIDGQLLAQGRFGEASGCHAIRLSGPGSDTDSTAVLADFSSSLPDQGLAPVPTADEGDDPFRMDMGGLGGLDGGFNLPEDRIAS